MEMRAELKGVLAKSKTTTIYVTHDQVEAMSLADRIAVMNQGRIVQAASPVEVYRNPAARFVGSFIGNPPMNFLPAERPATGRWQVAGEDYAGPARHQRQARVRHPPRRRRAGRPALPPPSASSNRSARTRSSPPKSAGTCSALSSTARPRSRRATSSASLRSPTASAGSIPKRRKPSENAMTRRRKNKTHATRAIAVIKENDRGTYTIPTQGLYPFQWNWDSCLTALGQAHYDEARAWTEIETLFAHQWPDGMVPHIVFHVYDDGYFPGPDVWGTGRPVATSGITQPPVAGLAVARLFDRATDKDRGRQAHSRRCLPKIDAWHRWFYATRDPQGEGLVAIIHPWESGRDNSVDWDEAFERVPTDGVAPYRRRDTQHADPAHRPTKAQYDRYLWLVQHFRALGWDNAKLHDASPFRVVDPGFNAILIRSCGDLARIARQLGEIALAEENEALAAKGLAALDRLWSEEHGQYLCLDRTTGELIDSLSIGGMMPVFAPIPPQRAKSIANRIVCHGREDPFHRAEPRPVRRRASTPSATGAGRSGWWSTT